MAHRKIIIFARTPRFGRVKTRLAHGIGPLNALRFYQNSLMTVVKRLRSLPGTDLCVALTPDRDAEGYHAPIFNNAPLIKQGSGDLGTRMARTFKHHSQSPVLIIGSDIPDIQPSHINAAFSALGENDAVFGPCDDGGYWLVGLKHLRATPPGFMKGVRWSSQHTLSDTIATLPKHWKLSYINSLNDIDDSADYRAWLLKQKTRI